MSPTVYVITTILLACAQVIYLRLARYFRIIDRPNERSSHTDFTTIRGGGVVFFMAELGAFWASGFTYPYFFLGLTLVTAISFLDDLRPLAARYRSMVQVVGMALLVYQTGVADQDVWIMATWLLVGVGILNVYNFMDGINGITAWYSLVAVGTLWVWQWQLRFLSTEVFLSFAFIALLLFSFVNARRRAICFSGDVGSVSMAFIILLPLAQLIIVTQTYLPILLLAVYGTDTILTIIQRLYQRQNIFKAHRQHLFQLLVHRLQWPHLRVSALYALTQLAINGLVIRAVDWSAWAQWWLAGGIVIALVSVYVGLKWVYGNE
jgi:UDP-GlcNAc:undecaprenyl-phosphate GlcNAc-1-phosphate transferase